MKSLPRSWAALGISAVLAGSGTEALAASAGEGLQLLESGNYPKAIEIFSLLQADPEEDCRKCQLYLAIAQYRQDDLTKARETVRAILADKDQQDQAPLSLGYAFLILKEEPDALWFEACLKDLAGRNISSADDKHFLAQSAMDASFHLDYGPQLRSTLADQVIRLAAEVALENRDLLGLHNLLGRAWILKGETQTPQEREQSKDENLKKALGEFQAEVEVHNSAIYLHNLSIATRLLGERSKERFWELRPMAPSNPESLKLAGDAVALMTKALEIVRKAKQAPDAEKYLKKLEILERTTDGRLQDFEKNRHVRRVLAGKSS